jgi:hypothetical protein
MDRFAFTTAAALVVAAAPLASSGLGAGAPASRPADPATQPAARVAERAGRVADVAAVEVVRRDVVIRDVDGVDRRPLDCGTGKAAVLIFLAHDCPISNGYGPEINRICAAYGGANGFAFTIVHPFGELSVAEAKKHATEYGYTVPVVVDGDRAVTGQVKPLVTPEAAVVGPDGTVLYRGRIDDKWAGYGRSRPEPTTRELRDALDAIRADRPVPAARTEAIGCPI